MTFKTRHLMWFAAAGIAGGACTTKEGFTDDETAVLSKMVIDDSTPIPVSATNRYADDPRAAELGHDMFFDKRWVTGAGNCRTCHDLTYGGADSKARTATTVFGSAALSRNTPTVFNTAFVPGNNHWSGNFTALWSIPSDVGSSALEQAHFIYDDPYYRPAYEDLFGPMPDLDDTTRFPPVGGYKTAAWMGMAADDQIAMGRFTTNIGKSIEAYERKLIDKNSPFDKYMDGDETALSPSAVRGAKLFIGKAACNECHNGQAFSDFKFHNVGVPQGALAVDYGFMATGAFQATYPFNSNGQFSDNPDYGAKFIALATPVATADLPMICGGSDPAEGCGAFKTARLRGVAHTAPYFHTGGMASLWDVVAFYNEGAGTDGYVGHRDYAIAPLFLSNDEITDIVAFLESLTGEPIPDEWAKCPTTIPATACMAP